MSFHKLTEYAPMPNEIDKEVYSIYLKGDRINIKGLSNPCEFQKAVYADRPDGQHLKYLQVVDAKGYVRKVRTVSRIDPEP